MFRSEGAQMLVLTVMVLATFALLATCVRALHPSRVVENTRTGSVVVVGPIAR